VKISGSILKVLAIKGFAMLDMLVIRWVAIAWQSEWLVLCTRMMNCTVTIVKPAAEGLQAMPRWYSR